MSSNEITSITNIIEPTTKQFKTKSYVLKAARTYREKHPEKLKEYREKYKKDKEQKDINLFVYVVFNYYLWYVGGSTETGVHLR